MGSCIPADPLLYPIEGRSATSGGGSQCQVFRSITPYAAGEVGMQTPIFLGLGIPILLGKGFWVRRATVCSQRLNFRQGIHPRALFWAPDPTVSQAVPIGTIMHRMVCTKVRNVRKYIREEKKERKE